MFAIWREEGHMARESYVHPVTGAVEPPPRWVPLWRFRATLMALAIVMIAIGIVAVQYFNGAYQGQDPTFEPGGSGLNQQTGTVPTPTGSPTATPSATSSSSAKPTELGGPG